MIEDKVTIRLKSAEEFLSKKAERAVRGLLFYSFTDIDFNFYGLTDDEKEIVGDEAVMEEICGWIKCAEGTDED